MSKRTCLNHRRALDRWLEKTRKEYRNIFMLSMYEGLATQKMVRSDIDIPIDPRARIKILKFSDNEIEFEKRMYHYMDIYYISRVNVENLVKIGKIGLTK